LRIKNVPKQQGYCGKARADKDLWLLVAEAEADASEI